MPQEQAQAGNRVIEAWTVQVDNTPGGRTLWDLKREQLNVDINPQTRIVKVDQVKTERTTSDVRVNIEGELSTTYTGENTANWGCLMAEWPLILLASQAKIVTFWSRAIGTVSVREYT